MARAFLTDARAIGEKRFRQAGRGGGTGDRDGRLCRELTALAASPRSTR